MITHEQAYSILEISFSATEEEIKAAFRKKAQLLHPDKNNSPDAHLQFLNLHEAYALLRGKTTRPFATGSKQNQQEDRMERARKAADNYARMKYEEYLKEVEMYRSSPYAWIFKILYYGLFFIYLLIAMVFVCIPLILFTHGIGWGLLSCPLWILSLFIFSYAYGWKEEIDPLFN